jgi:hypothetical protein
VCVAGHQRALVTLSKGAAPFSISGPRIRVECKRSKKGLLGFGPRFSDRLVDWNIFGYGDRWA